MMDVLAAIYCERMDVPACLLANDAAVVGSLLNVVGGGWEHFAVPRFPASITGWLAGLFELGAAERGTDQLVDINVVTRDGVELGKQSFIVNDVSRLVPFAKQFSVVVVESGTIEVNLSVNGTLARSAPCEVKLIEP